MNAVKNINPLNINPFSSRFVSPFSCEFIEDQANGYCVDEIASQLMLSKCVQIVGPHGCGKSTFAWQVAKRLEKHVRQIRVVTMRPQGRWRGKIDVVTQSPGDMAQQRALKNLYIVDGLEQLSAVSRNGLVHALKSGNNYSLLTTHRPLWFVRTRVAMRPSEELFRKMALALASGTDFQLTDELIASVYDQCGGNYRHGLSLLYDECG